MIDRIKNIFSGDEKKEKKEDLPVRLPEVSPFGNMDVETAPARAHRPDRVKKDIDHTGHMRVIVKSEEEVTNFGAEAQRRITNRKTVMYDDDAVSGYISDFPYLKFLTVTRNSDTLCTFPFFNIGKPFDARITEVTECENGYEGQIEAYTKGSALTFFDALYFKNRNFYYPGKEVKVMLSGIAYVLTKVKAGADDNASRHEAIDSGYLAFRYENGDLDDYVFRGRVKEVREFDVLGKRAQAIRVPIRIGADSVLEIYVFASGNAINEKLQKGDYVSGIVWLQGFILQAP